MRAFAVVVALAVLAVCHASPVKKEERDGLLVVYGYKHGEPCPAAEFYNNCNACFCLVDGHSAACNRMGCSRHPKDAAVKHSSVNVANKPNHLHNDAYSLTQRLVCKSYYALFSYK